MNAIQLKDILNTVRQTKFEAPQDLALSTLTAAMLDQVGTTDSELRDDLIYTTFVHWIALKPLIGSQDLQAILQRIEANMSYGIGDIATDTVFTRAFSVLLLPLILMRHHKTPFLSASQIINLKDHLLAYLSAEKDLRGFVVGKGWAHAVAHTADALSELVMCEELTPNDLVAVANAVRDKIVVETVYTHAEDERLLQIIARIFARDVLTPEQWQAWLSSFPGLYSKWDMPDGFARFINVKHFLQSLYFRADQNGWTVLRDLIAEILKKIL